MRSFAKKFISLLLVATMVCGLTITSFAADGDTTSVQYQVEYKQSDARNTLQYVNNFRQSDTWYWNSDNTTKTYVSNVGTLVYDYDLEEAAMQRAAEIAIYFSHTRPDGQSWSTAITESGYNYSSAGENLAAGTYYYVGTPEQVIEQLKEENEDYSGQGHRRNMLVSSYTNYAMGCVYMNNTYYWAMLLTKADGKNTTNPTTATNSTVTATVNVTNDRISFGSATFHDMELKVNGTATLPDLGLYITPSWAASSKSISVTTTGTTLWESSNKSVVDFDGNNMVAIGTGIATISATAGGMTVSFNVTVVNEVNAVYVEPKDSDAYTHGNIGYWYIEETNQYFRDEALTEEISYEDTRLPLALDDEHGETAHNWVITGYDWHTDEAVPTCTATVQCTNCGETDTVECEVSIGEEIGGEDHSEKLTIEWIATVMYDGQELTATDGYIYEQKVEAEGDHTPNGEGVKFVWSDDGTSCDAFFTCAECGEVVYVPCHVEETDSTEPTCTTEGKNIYIASCMINDQEYTDTKEVIVPALGHEFTGEATFDWSNDYSSCTAIFKCNRCGFEQRVNCTIDPTVEKEPTCTETGTTRYVAYAEFEYNGQTYSDSDVQYETVKALGHDFGGTPTFIWSDDYSSCTAYFACQRGCGAYDTVACDITSETTPASCTVDGNIVYTAVVTYNGETFSDSRTTVIDATGHTPVDDPAVAPTCTETGLTEGSHCAVCGAIIVPQEVVPALGHEWNDGVVTKEPNCTDTGIMTYTCERCGDTKEEVIPTNGEHHYVGTVTEPTCTEGGYTTYVCEYCGATYRADETSALGHEWNSGVVTKEPTCTESGVMTYTCERCGITETETIQALGHKWAEVNNNNIGDYVTYSKTDNSCTLSIPCENCGTVYTTVIEPYKSEVATQATCTTTGSTKYYYKYDGTNVTDGPEGTLEWSATVVDIPATDHSYTATDFMWIDKDGHTWAVYGERDDDFVWDSGVTCRAYLKCSNCGQEYEVMCTIEISEGYADNGLVVQYYDAVVGESDLTCRVTVYNGLPLSVSISGGPATGAQVGDMAAELANEELGTVSYSDVLDNLVRGISLDEALANVSAPSSGVSSSGSGSSNSGTSADGTNGAKTDDMIVWIYALFGVVFVGGLTLIGTTLNAKRKVAKK